MANQPTIKFEDKKWIKPAIWIFTVVVFLLVTLMGWKGFPKPDNPPAFTKALPALNAIINTSCFITLIASLIAIKRKNVNLHMRLNTFAMILSVFFLLSYVLYHITNPATPYGAIEMDSITGEEIFVKGPNAGIYYTILASHIILSAVSLPFILFAYYRAFIGDIEKHKKIVKFAYPIWLYVAITGPAVYLMLSPYYK